MRETRISKLGGFIEGLVHLFDGTGLVNLVGRGKFNSVIEH